MVYQFIPPNDWENVKVPWVIIPQIVIIPIFCGRDNAIGTTLLNDWEWSVYTTVKKHCDDWGMVQMALFYHVLPTSVLVVPEESHWLIKWFRMEKFEGSNRNMPSLPTDYCPNQWRWSVSTDIDLKCQDNDGWLIHFWIFIPVESALVCHPADWVW